MVADGIYQVAYGSICAGFIVCEGRVVACAPILRRRMGFWLTIARRIRAVSDRSAMG